MRKFTLLSLVLTFALALSMFLVACNGNTVSEHDHVWDDGTVTTEPTCHSEGLRTYSCTVDGCTQTKTEPIAMTQHNWDEGAVTEPSTCQSQGTKTYACSNEGCNATKTEKLQKSSHNWDEGVLTKVPDFYTPGEKKYTCQTDGCGETRTESVGAHADFLEQFYSSLLDANNWSYGYVADFDATSTSFTFEQITQIDAQSNAWKADGVEISKGYIYSQKNAAVMYTFKEVVKKGIQANVAISFVGEDSATVVKAYLFVTHTSGEPTKIELNKNGAKDWTYASEKAYDLAQGDSFTVVFSNKGQGKSGGTFTFTLTAPCNHVWGEAKVVKDAKCEDPGTMQYTCLECGKTKEEEIDPIGHKWDDGKITKDPTETEEGIKEHTCLNSCGETWEEKIPKLVPSTTEVFADFAKDFDLESKGKFNGWEIGFATYHWGEDANPETFEFTAITEKNDKGDAYKNNDPYMEIKGDWAALGGMLAIAYHFDEAQTININFLLNRAEGNTNGKFSLRWAVKNSSGAIVGNDGKASFVGDNAANGSLTFQNELTVNSGDTLFILINHDDGGDQCTYTYTLAKNSEKAFAEFKKDFHDGDTTNNWEYGSSVYAWNKDQAITIGEESFTYTKGTYNADTQAWESGDASIKAGSVDIRNNATIVYKFDQDMTVNIYLTFKGEEGKTVHSALRMVIVDNDGKGVKKLETFGVRSNTKNEWTATFENVQVKANYKIYIIFFEESGSDSTTAEFDCKFTSDQAQGGDEPVVPPTDETTVNFKDDFQATLDGEDNGWSVGNVEFNFDANTFVYTKTSKKNDDGDAFVNVDGKPFFEIKGDWAAIGNMAAIAYAFKGTGDVHFKFDITGIGSATFSVRYAVISASGTAKKGPEFAGNAAHVTAEADITVEAGDTLYIIINHENGGDDNQCKYTYTLTKYFDEPVVPGTPFDGANLAEDFASTIAGNVSGWTFGTVDYKFDGVETFEFTKIDANADKTAYVSGENSMNGTGATVKDSMMGIAYTFGSDAKVDIKFVLTCVGGTKFSVRWAIKNSAGAIINGANGKANWGGDTGDTGNYTLSQTVDVHTGETLYILINHENGEQCTYTYMLTKHSDGPVVPPTTEAFADFTRDFDLESEGKFNGWEIGFATYHWGEDANPETFEFTAITEKNDKGDAYKNNDPYMEIKGDWAALGGMLAIAYHFDEAQTININFLLNRAEGNTNGKFSLRWAVKSEDGTITSSGDGKASYVGNNAANGSLTFQNELTVNSGDTLFILINHDDGGNQCTFSLELNAKA